MKISIDGGALCSPKNSRYGTFHFSSSLLESLGTYDRQNQYDVYTYCTQKQRKPHVSSVTYHTLVPTVAWMSVRVSLEEYLRRHDVFLALNQALPLYTPARTIVWNHGLSYLHNPLLYPQNVSRLTGQLRNMIRRADCIVVTSRRVKEELADLTGTTPVHVIPIGVPYDMKYGTPLRRKPFFLFAGMNHPVKNIQWIIDAFLEFRTKSGVRNVTLKLATVTSDGLSFPRDSVQVINPSRAQLRQLYRTASAVLSASRYESFNMPILEALSLDCPVIALRSAVIPEMSKYVPDITTRDEFITALSEAIKHGKVNKTGLEIRNEFSWKKIVERIVALY